MKIVGYADRLSVAPGEQIRFMVSCYGLNTYEARVEKLIHGDENPQGPGFKSQPVAAPINGTYTGREQASFSGSYMHVPPSQVLDGLSSFTLSTFIWPTTPRKGKQALLGQWHEGDKRGYHLLIDPQGCLSFAVADGTHEVELHLDQPLRPKAWYFIGASYHASDKSMVLFQSAIDRYRRLETPMSKTIDGHVSPRFTGLPLLLAADLAQHVNGRCKTVHHFNGKIDRSGIFRTAIKAPEIVQTFDNLVSTGFDQGLVCKWDFSKRMTSTMAVDIGPYQRHGHLINLPARAMKGFNWDGSEYNWTHAPSQYAAVHFHDDDVYDIGWEPDILYTVPETMPSGLYALHVFNGEEEDYIPFCVRPPRDRATAKVAFLLPTASIMAYANTSGHIYRHPELLVGRLTVLQKQDLMLSQHKAYGLSLYDVHTDGSGVCYSSRFRPILNMRPKYSSSLGGSGSGIWQFNANTHLIDWLEHQAYGYDVITDEDLHDEGLNLLERYRVVLTGTHPEYHSTQMLDALEAYVQRGGRLVYLGGDGFYWKIAFHAELPGVIEVRRTEDGIRSWQAQPGEYHHSFVAECGGMWRRMDRAPQRLVGVGMTAQGFDVSSYYRRTPESYTNARVAFIFENIHDDILGNFGLVGGGAAGLELDRLDPALGSPQHAVVLASSEGHGEIMLIVKEELGMTLSNVSGTDNPLVRSDMVFFETEGGGAVFATSSIAWCGSLSHNRYDNNISQMLANVLNRFLRDEPFPWPSA